MSGIFGSSPPPPAPLPMAPALDPSQIADREKKAAQEALAASGGGRASTMLTGGGALGDVSDNSVVKRLLGA